MSLAAQYHAEHKARLARMGAIPMKGSFYIPPTKKVELPKLIVFVPPLEVAYRSMWFWDLVSFDGERSPVSVKEIQTAVARVYNVPISDFSAKRKTKDIVFPRQVAMYLCKVLTDLSYPQIGRYFGGRDHSTIIHACKVITKQMDVDSDLLNLVRSLRARFE
jgi:chromosomal replication initiator protein